MQSQPGPWQCPLVPPVPEVCVSRGITDYKLAKKFHSVFEIYFVILCKYTCSIACVRTAFAACAALQVAGLRTRVCVAACVTVGGRCAPEAVRFRRVAPAPNV